MAYKTADLKKTAIKAIGANDTIFFIEDLVAFLPCTKPTFYEHFPNESDDYKELTDLLSENKITMKVKIRATLSKGTKSGELLALYRLICTPEERKMLNQSYIDHTTGGEKIDNKITKEQVQDIADKINDKI